MFLVVLLTPSEQEQRALKETFALIRGLRSMGD